MSTLSIGLPLFVIFFQILSLLSLHAHPTSVDPTSSSLVDFSFSRLESEENSGEIVNQCCTRVSNFVTLGQSIDGEEVRIDVGGCKQQCNTRTVRPLQRDEFDKFLKKYPEMDPIQIFLTLQTQKLGTEELDMSSFKNQSESLDLSSLRLSSASCLSATCHPTSVRRHRHYGISGHSHDVDIIESCHCVPLPPICRRESNFIRFHEGTPYEETLDVGRCAGSCDTEGERSFCKSVRNKTVTVQGPNGAACFPVVEECQCVGNCYRTREFLEVYDYSLLFPKLNAQNMSSSLGEAVSEGETISNEPLVKVIDVGRCEGSCRVKESSSKCLIWSSDHGKCLSLLYGGHSHCAPTKLASHFYIDRNGQRHSLISVTSCGCR